MNQKLELGQASTNLWSVYKAKTTLGALEIVLQASIYQNLRIFGPFLLDTNHAPRIKMEGKNKNNGHAKMNIFKQTNVDKTDRGKTQVPCTLELTFSTSSSFFSCIK